MSTTPPPLNPFTTTLVAIGIVGLVLAAVFAGVANAQSSTPLAGLAPAEAFWVTAGWCLAVGMAAILAALVVAAVRWTPRERPAAEAEPSWSISFPDREA